MRIALELLYNLTEAKRQFKLHEVRAVAGTWEGSQDTPYVFLSDDAEKLKACYGNGGAVVALLTEENRNQDFAFCRYAVMDTTAIDDEYVDMVYCRTKGIPLVIAESERLVLRELTPKDSDAILHLYEDGEARKYLGVFYNSPDEIPKVIDRYCKEVYGFYGYGIWGVYLRDTNKFIGLVGYTPREKGLELGFAIDRDYRLQGYAKEAIEISLDYARDYLGESNIKACVSQMNDRALKLLNYLGFIEINHSNIAELSLHF